MIQSNERMAALALKLAHEAYTGPCIECGAHGVEMHEILSRAMRPLLGSTVAILGVTLAPLCQKCHRKYEKMTTEQQLIRLENYMFGDFMSSSELVVAQRDQLIALKARCHVCK